MKFDFDKILCMFCALDASSHSFRRIDWQNKEMNLFYSCPAESKKYFERETVIHHFDTELANNENNSWAWIVDCKGFTMKHGTEISSIIELADLITNKYANCPLKKIWIINTNSIVSFVIRMILPFIPGSISNVIETTDKTVEQIQAMRFVL